MISDLPESIKQIIRNYYVPRCHTFDSVMNELYLRETLGIHATARTSRKTLLGLILLRRRLRERLLAGRMNRNPTVIAPPDPLDSSLMHYIFRDIESTRNRQ